MTDREPFAHTAILTMSPAGDTAAPGGAITQALCGTWNHEPPCPLAPHHTTATRSGPSVHLRILFATPPASESTVRQRIDDALAAGTLTGPDGVETHWHLVSSSPTAVTETEHAQRLVDQP